MSIFRLFFCLTICLGISLLARAPLAAAEKPNFILVFIDDMGWGDFSCFGNQEASTPNVDRLAREGIAFEQFYVNSPICSPSRVAISTGQYPQRWRVTSYLAHRKANEQRGIDNWLDPSAPMLARYLQDSGYMTGHFGKWHMGGQRDVAEAPLITAYGFDESITNFEGLGARILPLKYSPGQPAPQMHNLGSDSLGHGPVIWHDRAYITAKFVEAASVFVRFAEQSGQPFYLNLWPDDVHTPMHPPIEKWGDGSERQRYLAVLEEMDAQLGALFQLVEKSETLRENTMILICSDNGPEVGLGSPGPFRGSKATLYEAGVRSPLVVWAPGLMKPEARGTRNVDSMFSAMDLVPSMLNMAEVQSSESVKFDGENLSDLLLGRSSQGREAPLFFRRPPDRKEFRHQKDLPDLAMREGPWKFYCDFDSTRPELYNLEADPGESQNLAGSHKDIVQKMSKSLLSWNDSMPKDKGADWVRKKKK